MKLERKQFLWSGSLVGQQNHVANSRELRLDTSPPSLSAFLLLIFVLASVSLVSLVSALLQYKVRFVS